MLAGEKQIPLAEILCLRVFLCGPMLKDILVVCPVWQQGCAGIVAVPVFSALLYSNRYLYLGICESWVTSFPQ